MLGAWRARGAAVRAAGAAVVWAHAAANGGASTGGLIGGLGVTVRKSVFQRGGAARRAFSSAAGTGDGRAEGPVDTAATDPDMAAALLRESEAGTYASWPYQSAVDGLPAHCSGPGTGGGVGAEQGAVARHSVVVVADREWSRLLSPRAAAPGVDARAGNGAHPAPREAALGPAARKRADCQEGTHRETERERENAREGRARERRKGAGSAGRERERGCPPRLSPAGRAREPSAAPAGGSPQRRLCPLPPSVPALSRPSRALPPLR